MIFALLLIASSVLLAGLTMGERSKIILDLGLASINLFGVLIAIFIGIGLVSKEIERRTLYTVLAKPVTRVEFLIGKYLGLLLTLLVNTGIMTLALVLVLGMTRTPLPPDLMLAVFFIFLELSVVTAMALFFSTFTTTTLAAIFTLSLYVTGHLLDDLKGFGEGIESLLAKAVLNGLYYGLPNLEHFNLKGRVVYQMTVGTEEIVFVGLYGLVWIGLLLLGAALIFQRRDFR